MSKHTGKQSQKYTWIYHVYTLAMYIRPLFYGYTWYILGYDTMYIHDIGYTMYIHEYTTYISDILVTFPYVWDVHGIYQAYTENRSSRCFIPHLLILQIATLLNKVLLTCNAWTMFRVRCRNDFHLLIIMRQPVPKAYRKCCVKCKMKCSHLKSTQKML